MSTVAQKIMMGSGAVALPSDDQFNRTSFLSHFEGSNDGVNNQFTDGSDSNHTITANGGVTQGSFGPFARPNGEWAVDLVPSTGFLRATGAGDISGDFTVETWVFMNKDNGNYIHLTYNVGGLVNVFNVYNGSVQNFLFGTSSTGGQTTLEFNDTTWDAGVWTHLAMVRSSGTLKIYVNGVADATTSTAVSGNLTDLEYIGTGRGFTSNARIFDGKVSNVRFSSTARYTSNFTPPTAPFTTDSDTNLLTCQSNRFVDNSSNGYTITPAGSAAVTAFGPFLTSAVYKPAVNGASVYIAAGDSDYLSMPAQTIPTGNFTVEGWYYLDGTQSNSTIIAQGSSGNAARTFVGIEAVGGVQSLRFQMGSSLVTPNFAAIPNQWTHFCATYNGSAMELFQNGVSGGTTSRSGDAENVAMVIGRLNTNWANSYGVKGYISNIRVSSVVRQSSNFTPPTSPLTNVDSNVKFLANMADGQAIDSAAQNTLTLVGTAKTSTAQKKFGTASLLLDGNSDYVSFADADSGSMFNFGATKWTIEGWFYQENDAGSGSNSHAIISRWDNQNSDKGFVFRIINSSGQKLQWLHTADGSTNVSYTDSRTISNDTWYHFALVKNDNLTLYLNGTGAVLNSSTFTIASTTIPTLIGSLHESGSPSQYFDGYIDDLRVSHMARYTSNFTAPTEAFPDKGQ